MINNKILKEDGFRESISLISLAVIVIGNIFVTTSFVWGIAIMLASWLKFRVLAWLVAFCTPICHYFFGEVGDQSIAWLVAHHPLVAAFSFTFVLVLIVQILLLPLTPVVCFLLSKSVCSTSEMDLKKDY